jgi:transcriptional regulator with XRE-family HTH domain
MPQMTKEEVREARTLLGLTQKQLAERLDLNSTNSAATVRGWEAGRRVVGGPEGVAIRLMVRMHELFPPPPEPPAPPPPPKRPRGRPRKEVTEPVGPKRPRGRPRKDAAQ